MSVIKVVYLNGRAELRYGILMGNNTGGDVA